jgi:NAD(P)-dependent dehydrogenase (short-subunit alcohol dehydrogenase family)
VDLTGKVAIVTGGSRGIGRAVSHGLAQAGAKVVVASRSEDEVPPGSEFERFASGNIHATAESIRQSGRDALAVPCDVTKATDIQDLIENTLSHYGRIDILFSNAGIDCESPVVDLDPDLLDRCLAVNVRAPLLLCKYALPTILERGSGSIIGVTSGSARGYREGRVGYSLSKAALERLLLSLAEEVRPHNIAVNAFSPGRVDTWMNRRGDWPGTAHIPMVQPDVVIPAAVWLAGQSAETFTGQVVERADFGVTWGTTPGES